MLSEKPLTPTVAHTSADPGVFKQGKQDMLHRCVSAPKGRGNPFRGENSVQEKMKLLQKVLKSCSGLPGSISWKDI